MNKALMSNPLFAALDPEAAGALRASMVELRARKGDVIFVEGEPGDRLYIVVEGKVVLGQQAQDGRETLLAVQGPGEMFGELSLFDQRNEPRMMPNARTDTIATCSTRSGGCKAASLISHPPVDTRPIPDANVTTDAAIAQFRFLITASPAQPDLRLQRALDDGQPR